MAKGSLEANDDDLSVNAQLATPGFIQCLGGSASHRHGISLEVNLGYFRNPVENNRLGIVVRGPNSNPNTNPNWASTRPSLYKGQTKPNGCNGSITNGLKSKKKGKRMVRFSYATQSLAEVSGYSYLARMYGHKGASSSKPTPKCALFLLQLKIVLAT